MCRCHGGRTDARAGGSSAFGRLLAMEQPPTAIVAPTDVIAIGMLHGALRHGLDVPGDVSITGFDDIPEAAFTVSEWQAAPAEAATSGRASSSAASPPGVKGSDRCSLSAD